MSYVVAILFTFRSEEHLELFGRLYLIKIFSFLGDCEQSVNANFSYLTSAAGFYRLLVVVDGLSD